MRKVSFRRWLPWLAAITWIAVVFWYWKTLVPLVPQLVMDRKDRFFVTNPAQPGVPFLVQQNGTVDVVDPESGSLTRIGEFPGHFEHTMPGLAITGASYESDLVRLSDVSRLSSIRWKDRYEDGDSYLLAMDGNVLISRLGWTATAFDVQTGKELWSRNGIRSVRTGSATGFELVRVDWQEVPQSQADGRWGKRHCYLVDARTGEPDPRFRNIPRLGWIVNSPDRTKLAVLNGSWVRMFDIATGRPLWASESPQNEAARFSPDGSEFQVPYLIGSHFAGLARWNSVEGRVLESGPTSAIAHKEPLSPDGRFSVHTVAVRAAPLFLIDALNRWGFYRVARAINRSSYRVIVDNRRQAIVGRLADTESFQEVHAVVFDDARQQVCVLGSKTIAWYSLPPRRDWQWLVGWGVGPPLVVWCIRRVRRRKGRAA
jgi:hypothetical protein